MTASFQNKSGVLIRDQENVADWFTRQWKARATCSGAGPMTVADSYERPLGARGRRGGCSRDRPTTTPGSACLCDSRVVMAGNSSPEWQLGLGHFQTDTGRPRRAHEATDSKPVVIVLEMCLEQASYGDEPDLTTMQFLFNLQLVFLKVTKICLLYFSLMKQFICQI